MNTQRFKELQRATLILALALFISACAGSKKDSEFFKEEKAAKKPRVVDTFTLKRNWRVSVGPNIEFGDAMLSPGVLGNSVYVASKNGKVQKRDLESGKQVWEKKIKKTVLTAGVGVGGGLVLVGTQEGLVYALDQSNGEISWSAQLSTEVLAAPVVDNNIVIVRTGDGLVSGLSSYNGELKWTISRQLPRLTLRGESQPLVFQGLAVIGFPDGTLAAVEAQTGRALWDFPIAFPKGTNEIDRLSDIDTTPLLVGNNIYVSSYQDITHALNIAQQRIEWSAEVSSFHPLSYDSAHLYISDKNGVVHQMNRANGTTIWSQPGLRYREVSGPISLGANVIVGDGDGSLFAIDKSNGKYVGRFSLGANRIVGNAIVDSSNVIFMDSDGNLQSIRLEAK